MLRFNVKAHQFELERTVPIHEFIDCIELIKGAIIRKNLNKQRSITIKKGYFSEELVFNEQVNSSNNATSKRI
jgi:hypothetical protein